ncbi:MAG: peptidoglycan DD-metalloendopeptidase family protein, partial [Acidimicrobiia bacterium]|nr:peptidoglycan DD-metalloendopeptidase family protein [Acidimicrobiia bacterium]
MQPTASSAQRIGLVERIHASAPMAVVAVTGLGTILSPAAFAQPASATVGPYRLPWQAGKTFRVSQTQGSSHQGAMLHAIDFALPLGEAVLAARGGTLAFREDGFSGCGGPSLATRGNYVVVDHGDGTSALYLHLQQVRVQVGQRVAQGTVL